jgi:ElaB/YqjD/DUF883 family membrane-anchored ribosome-binding protein
MAEFDNDNLNNTTTDQPGYAGTSAGTEGQGMYHGENTRGNQTSGKAIEDLLSVARDLRSNLSLLVGAGRNVATEQAGRLRQNAGRVFQNGKDRAGQLAGSTGDYVKDEPLKALAIAAGAGLVLGFLLKRTR